MIPFTIFYNEKTGAYAAVYDFNLPTQTGIGSNKNWVPVYRGLTTGLFDKIRQKNEFIGGPNHDSIK